MPVADMIRKIAVDLRAELGLCGTPNIRSFVPGEPAPTIADCMRGTSDNLWRGQMQEVFDVAESKGVLDPVERAMLSRLSTAIIDISGKDLAGIRIQDTPLQPMPRGKGSPLPSWTEYRRNLADFAALRKAKGTDEKLPQDLVDRLKKAYVRKVNGVGKVTIEQYLASRLSRLQLNELAGLMVKAADILNRPVAHIEFYPADYSTNSQLLQQLRDQETTLGDQIANTQDPSLRQALIVQLQELEKSLKAAEQDDPLDSLKEQKEVARDRLHQLVLKLTDPVISSNESASLGNQIEVLQRTVSDLDQKIAALTRSLEIPPEDTVRLALNQLKIDFNALKQEEPFSRLNLQFSDVLLAAWVSGDLPSDALRALGQLAPFKEDPHAVWKKAAEIGWDVGKAAMMAFPVTSYVAVAISILIEVYDANKKARKEPSDAAHLIPLLP